VSRDCGPNHAGVCVRSQPEMAVPRKFARDFGDSAPDLAPDWRLRFAAGMNASWILPILKGNASARIAHRAKESV
jgi:hypothetical protein